jgi:hypothetical protein
MAHPQSQEHPRGVDPIGTLDGAAADHLRALTMTSALVVVALGRILSLVRFGHAWRNELLERSGDYGRSAS